MLTRFSRQATKFPVFLMVLFSDEIPLVLRTPLIIIEIRIRGGHVNEIQVRGKCLCHTDCSIENTRS